MAIWDKVDNHIYKLLKRLLPDNKKKKILLKTLIPLSIGVVLVTVLPISYCSCNNQPIVKAYLIDGSNWDGQKTGNLNYVTDTSNPSDYTVTYIGNNNYEANNLIIPDVVTDGTYTYIVTSIGYDSNSRTGAFQNCTNLTGSLTIPNSVTSIGQYAFDECTNLSIVYLSTHKLDIGKFSFYNCTNLTSIALSGDTTFTIGDSAFMLCDNLIGFSTNYKTILGNRKSSLAYRAFTLCRSLSLDFVKRIEISTDGTPEIQLFTDYVPGTNLGTYAYVTPISGFVLGTNPVRNEGCGGLLVGSIPANLLPNNAIGDDAFNGCNNLLSIAIPSGTTKIGARAFKTCQSLTTFNLQKSTTISLNSFQDCSSLHEITGSYDTIPAISLSSSAFNGVPGNGTVENTGNATSSDLLTWLQTKGDLASWQPIN